MTDQEEKQIHQGLDNPGAYHWETLRHAKADLPIGRYRATRSAAARFMEEATELALECGLTPGEILVHVADALTNEAKKGGQGFYPSMVVQPGNGAMPWPNSTKVEIADAEICIDLIRYLARVDRADVEEYKKEKLELLRRRVLDGDFQLVNNRLYKKDRP